MSRTIKDANEIDRINLQMVQNVLLIWLDSNIDENSNDCRNTIRHLRRIVNTINTFTDGQKCIEFLNTLGDEKVCMIISGFLGQHIVPSIHNLSQVDSIFIFCGNIQRHEGWIKDWSKIKGIFIEINPICEALKQAAQQCEQNAISISIMNTGDDLMKSDIDQLDPSFMYTQIMKEILLTITFEQQHMNEFIEYCQEVFIENESELKNVDQLAGKYDQYTPIWWYTYECFLYPMLNRSLRMMDTNLIIKLGFFISDLHRQIEQLHREQFQSDDSREEFIVYRGQGMEMKDLKKMTGTKGGLLSFNCFLSTSKDRQTSLEFAQRALTNDEMIGVLFVMTINSARSNTPFASVVDVGYFGAQENEILFSMHTVFRIGQIKSIDDNPRLVRVELTLTSDNDKDLRQLTDHIREETFPDAEGWYRLGLVLGKMGQSGKAEQVFQILLEQETDENAKTPIFNQLGLMKDELGEYEAAIQYFNKSIEIEEKCIPRDEQSLAASYNNIGVVYSSMGDYSKALSSHEKALTVQKQSLPSTHLHLASSYANIGSVYYRMGDYHKALSSHEKALTIEQQSLPPNHPTLAMSYGNIGNVYCRLDDYPKALSSYQKTLAIQQQSLPSTHPSLAMSYNNIGNVYLSIGDYPKALSSHEEALTIRQQSLPSIHPSLASTYYNIGSVHKKMGNYSKAHSCFERVVDIAEQSLPSNHPDLQDYRNELIDIKKKL